MTEVFEGSHLVGIRAEGHPVELVLATEDMGHRCLSDPPPDAGPSILDAAVGKPVKNGGQPADHRSRHIGAFGHASSLSGRSDNRSLGRVNATDSVIRISIAAELETEQVAHFAVRELRDHLRRLTGATVVVVPPGTRGAALSLTVDPDVGRLAAGDAFPLDTPERDDAIAIDTTGGVGRIVGRNPRSLLIAVYRYLRELGWRWLRPGVDGEHRPTLTADNFSATTVKLTECASLRHRGICIEGSVSLTEVIDLVEWLPKVGMNTYFVQFIDGGPFLRNWYGELSESAARRARDRIVAAAQERGLVFHGVGHGWTTAAIGLESTGWDTASLDGQESSAPIAEVNGVRELWGGIPTNTELCYSDPKARQRFTDAVVSYARTHSEVDILHIWLSDGNNNHCECQNCAPRRPSDWYVDLLNEIDAALTTEQLPTRLAVLAYHQLLWAPREGGIINPDRMIFMFAPITRDYRESLPAAPTNRPMSPYPGNSSPRVEFDELLSSLRDWREYLDSDSFNFDYHFMWQYTMDPGMTRLARIIADDLRHSRALGLNGLVSCQSQRTFLPDGMAVALMAQLLWDADTDVDTFRADHHAHEYGEAAPVVVAHLERLSEIVEAVGLNQRHPETVAASPGLAAALRTELRDFLDAGEPAGLRPGAWIALAFHDELWLRMADCFEAVATGHDPETALAHFASYADTAPAQLQSQFDTHNVTRTVARFVRGSWSHHS